MKAAKIKVLRTIFIFFAIITLGLTTSCKPKTEANKEKPIIIDEKFNALFAPDSGGVTGADGIFSVPLPDGQSAFLMGDCFLGKVNNNQRDINTKMLNNSFIIINEQQNKARAIYKGTYDNPMSIIEPVQTDDTNRWYWPGHGFTEDSTLYIFALNMYTDPAHIVKSEKDEADMDEIDRMTETMFAFQVSGVDLLSFSLPDFKQQSVDRVEYAYNTDIHFGNSVFTEGKYIYLLGTKNYSDMSRAHIARTQFGNKPYYANWEFYNGEEWVKDYKQSKPLDIDISVSEQFSLFKIQEKYVLLIQEKTSGDIYTYTSKNPHSGYSNKQFIYHTPERENGVEGMTTYNAMAHPQYIENDMLLVSYCTNASVRAIFDDVNNYRPRFIRVPISKIDASFKGDK